MRLFLFERDSVQKVALYTLGCKLNFSETSTIGKQFLKNGYSIVDFKEKADVYVINTCSVTENAERECRQVVRRALRMNPSAFIAVTGCYAQLRPEEISSITGVDAVLGSNEKFQLFNLIDSFQKKELSCVYVSPTEKLDHVDAAFSTDADSRTRAFLKIQDGCDYKCSFCTIPLARGLSRSLPVNEVLTNFSSLLEQGYKEIILTGVNVGDYGKNTGTNLYELLCKMTAVEGDFRLRISSIEPNLLTDEIIELTKNNEKMCRHFHIPLQSGSTAVLKLMQRRYTTAQYKKVINKVKESIPDCGIGVDVIVGFPGETEEHFLETYAFLRDLPVSYLHVFTYSERPDTKAINMPGSVEHQERKRRNSMLRILSVKKRNEFFSTMVNNELSVLFEHENHNGKMHGFASNYVKVVMPFNDSFVNRVAKVRILSAENEICRGEFSGSIALNNSIY